MRAEGTASLFASLIWITKLLLVACEYVCLCAHLYVMWLHLPCSLFTDAALLGMMPLL